MEITGRNTCGWHTTHYRLETWDRRAVWMLTTDDVAGVQVNGSRRQVNDSGREKTTTHTEIRDDSVNKQAWVRLSGNSKHLKTVSNHIIYPDWFWLRFKVQSETSSCFSCLDRNFLEICWQMRVKVPGPLPSSGSEGTSEWFPSEQQHKI